MKKDPVNKIHGGGEKTWIGDLCDYQINVDTFGAFA